MINIKYFDSVGREQQVTFDSFNEFTRSQQACWHDIPDYFKVKAVTINNHDLNYQGQYGSLYHFLLKQDLTQYDRNLEE